MKRLLLLLTLVCGVGVSFAAKKSVADELVLHYPSVDQYGDSLTVSGKLSVPIGVKPKGIVLVPHYTIIANQYAPSVSMTADAKVFQRDYVVLAPDYIGYGLTKDRIHPYLHGELTARTCVDMYLGALPKLDSLQLGIPLDSIYIVGFSQGGATAVWTLKLIEEEYADRIHVIECFAGSGPYDVAVTMEDGHDRDKSGMPMVIPLLIVGTDASYDLKLDRSFFFTPAMEKAYSRYIEGKDHDLMTVYFKTLNKKVSHWLTPQATDRKHPQAQRLYEGLLRSSLVSEGKCPSWIPKSPLYVFHSLKDDVVTIRCAENLQRCFPDMPNITYDFGNYGGHLSSSRRFFPKVREMIEAHR